MTEEITEAIRNAFNEYLNAVDKVILENQTLQIELQRLKQELKWANDEEKYLKDCCIKAGKELEKHSFEWDGKEKNLVVQALEINKRYEALKQENEAYKQSEQEATEIIAELKQKNAELATENHNLRKALEEIREDMEQDTTCESKECGCDDYAECLNCIKETILNKINEVLNESN